MSLYFQSISILVGIFLFILYTEERMAEYINLNLKWLWIKIQSLWWILNNHPMNPILRMKMKIRYYFITRALQKEFKESQTHIQNND